MIGILLLLISAGLFVLAGADPAPNQTQVEQKLDAAQFQTNGQ